MASQREAINTDNGESVTITAMSASRGNITHSEDTRQDNHHHQQSPASARFLHLVPSKVKCSFSQNQHGAASGLRTGTSRTVALDCEAGNNLEKRNQRNTENWLVAVSAAGVIVTGIVLVIVLFPLLTANTSYRKSTSTNDHVSNIPSLTSPASERSIMSNLDEENLNVIFHTDDHDSGASFHRPLEPSLDLQKFYNHVAKNIQGAINASVKPCDDFYEYACGNWIAENPLPDGVSTWSNFEAMTIRIWDMMERELEILAFPTNNKTQPPPSSKFSFFTQQSPPKISLLRNADPSIRDLVVTYYAACENETQLTKMGVNSMKDILNKLDHEYQAVSKKLQPQQAFQRLLEYVHHDLAIHAFFGWKVEVDNTIANALAIELIAPNLDLLPQGTILQDNNKLITEYKKYATKLLELVGAYNTTVVENEVDIIVRFLEIYVPISGSLLVNDTNIGELNNIAPFLDWQSYFNKGFNRVGAFIKRDERILSLIQDYLTVVSGEIMTELSANGSDRLYVFLRWQVIQYYSQFLHKPARDTIIPIFETITGESVVHLPYFRFRPCIKELEERLALPIAYLMLETIKQQLHEETTIKKMITNVKNMANNIREEYLNYIDSFTWLKESAKQVLLEKLRSVEILVGYPPILDDKIGFEKMFGSLQFSRDNLLQNQINLLTFNFDRKMRFLRQPDTHSNWEVLSPMSLISFYVYRRNVLIIPLGGFMYPLYSHSLPESLAYATMGTFISHELGHAVDFVGRTRDNYGRVNASLWDDSTVKEFVQKVLCRVSEYSDKYYPVQGLMTIAEVMADDGSIGTSYKTVRDELQHTQFPDSLGNLMKQLKFSPDQFFFLYYAQLFCTASLPGTPLKGVDHYPPHPIRVKATLTNTPDFHKAFNCQKGTNMNPDKVSCDIW